jgi:hypothetical protein
MLSAPRLEVIGPLNVVTELIEKFQSFNPNSAKRHKDYSLLSGRGVRETMNHETTIYPSIGLSLSTIPHLSPPSPIGGYGQS